MTPTAGRFQTGDEDLLARCRRGDELAWVELLQRYEKLVYSVPRGYGLSRDDSADVAQSTFAELLKNLDSIRDPDALGGWLATVARRTTWKRISKGARREIHLDTVEPDPETDPWHEWMETWVERDWVIEGLLALGGPCRDLLVSLYLDPSEPTYEEVAARLGRPIGSIGPTRGRCLEKLRRALDELSERT